MDENRKSAQLGVKSVNIKFIGHGIQFDPGDPSHQNRAVVGRMHFKILLHLYGKNKINKKKLRVIFGHKIAMLHPIYT